MDDRLAKQVVFRYNGHINLDETQLDPSGELTFRKGTIVQKHGKNWKVTSVDFEPVEKKSLPSLKVYLVIALGK